ncbi:MAG: efflux RND transporter periplasmic adaptor subunit, partial [Gammaproteobacteria bacterium]
INAEVRTLPVVPVNALVWRGSLPGIYVINEQNKRELRLVRTGDSVGSDGVAILSGLQAGERIVLGAAGSGDASNWR